MPRWSKDPCRSSVETVSVMRLHGDMDESGDAAIEEIVPGLIEKLGVSAVGYS